MDRLEADARAMKPWSLAAILTGGSLLILAATLIGFPTPSLAQGSTRLSIDVDPTGNTATSVADIDTCASAKKGDTFDIDLVIEDVTDLLAWGFVISYDPQVLGVRDSDTLMFQAANPGSRVIDLSEMTPDDDGTYLMQSLDVGDPPSPDSGSGVLARLTFTAKAPGISRLAIDKLDLNDDGTLDQGPLLRNVAADYVGDEDGDTFFDGPNDDAEIRVGEPCPDAEGATVQARSDDGTDLGLVIGVVVGVLAAVTLAIAVVVYLRRRRAAGP